MTFDLREFKKALPEFIVVEEFRQNQVRLHCKNHGIVPAPGMRSEGGLDRASMWLMRHLAEDHGGLSRPEMWNSNLPWQSHPTSGLPGQTVILSADAIEAQRAWSEETFGPGWRNGTVEHLKKEAQEIIDAYALLAADEDATPEDLQGECIDALILAIDLCWRSGMSGADTITRYFDKRLINSHRTWPDWRGLPTDVAIEHDRSKDKPMGEEEFQAAMKEAIAKKGDQMFAMPEPTQVIDLAGDPQSFVKVCEHVGLGINEAMQALYDAASNRPRVHFNVSNASLTLESLAAIYGSDVETLHKAIVRATTPPETASAGPQPGPTPFWAPKEDMWMGKATHEWVIQCFGVGEAGQGNAERWASEKPDEHRRIWSQPPPAPGTEFFTAEKVPATTRLVPTGN